MARKRRLHYTETDKAVMWTLGFATNVRLCHEQDEVPVGDEVLAIDRKTTLRILSSGGFVDADETRAVYSLFD